MPHTEIIEKYLTRVILYKEKQKVYSDFCDEQKRNALLNGLFRDLDFDDDLWAARLNFARQAYKTFRLLNSDSDLGRSAPKTHALLLEKYIRRAIALDPYNVEFLKAFFQNFVGQKNPDKKLALHYISLYHPNSPEFQNLLVDLNVKQNEISFDYLSDTVTIPFINEMVLLKQKAVIAETDLKSDKKLKEIALAAGLDSKMLDTLSGEVPQMVVTVQKNLGNHWLDWAGTHKATLAMEKALDLAPYNKEVLITAISFYGAFCWRLVLGYNTVKGNAGRDEFFEFIFGVKKPNKKEIYQKAAALFFKSLELKDRINIVLQQEAKEVEVKKGTDNFFMVILAQDQ